MVCVEGRCLLISPALLALEGLESTASSGSILITVYVNGGNFWMHRLWGEGSSLLGFPDVLRICPQEN